MERRNHMTLGAVRLTYSSDLLIQYTTGAEHDPANPFGRLVLTVTGGGEVAVTQLRHGIRRRWSGRTTRRTIDGILELLTAARFPLVADHAIPPGSLRDIRVTLDGRMSQTAPIAYHVPPVMPAYQLVFQLFDELVTAVSEDAVPIVATLRSGLLADESADSPA